MDSIPIKSVYVCFNTELQDIGLSSNLAFDNISTIHYDNGNVVELNPYEDAPEGLAFEWARWKKDSTGVLTRHILTNAQNLTPALHYTELCDTLFLIELKVTDTVTWKTWNRLCPVKIIWNNVPVAPYEPFMTPFSVGQLVWNDMEWHKCASRVMLFGKDGSPSGEFFGGGKIGDLDYNGAINTADLLLLTSKFGK
jgi:hypothetical protein